MLIRPFGGLFRDIGGLSIFWGRVLCIALYFKFVSKNTFENNFIDYMYAKFAVSSHIGYFRLLGGGSGQISEMTSLPFLFILVKIEFFALQSIEASDHCATLKN